jgi:hypothetical protein
MADQGAAAARLSVFGNNEDEKNWNSGDEDFKFQETFFDFVDKQFARQVSDKILLNTIVTKIDYTQSTIQVTDSKNNFYNADKVIITVPIPILKSSDIQFIPALPEEKTRAFSKIGMDAGMKVFLKFSNKFFDQNIIGGKICAAYADDSVGKAENDVVGCNSAIEATTFIEIDDLVNLVWHVFFTCVGKGSTVTHGEHVFMRAIETEELVHSFSIETLASTGCVVRSRTASRAPSKT